MVALIITYTKIHSETFIFSGVTSRHTLFFVVITERVYQTFGEKASKVWYTCSVIAVRKVGKYMLKHWGLGVLSVVLANLWALNLEIGEWSDLVCLMSDRRIFGSKHPLLSISCYTDCQVGIKICYSQNEKLFNSAWRNFFLSREGNFSFTWRIFFFHVKEIFLSREDIVYFT